MCAIANALFCLMLRISPGPSVSVQILGGALYDAELQLPRPKRRR